MPHHVGCSESMRRGNLDCPQSSSSVHSSPLRPVYKQQQVLLVRGAVFYLISRQCSSVAATTQTTKLLTTRKARIMTLYEHQCTGRDKRRSNICALGHCPQVVIPTHTIKNLSPCVLCLTDSCAYHASLILSEYDWGSLQRPWLLGRGHVSMCMLPISITAVKAMISA